MLILAGVSISAIVGDDGVLSKAQYANFINEMAAVEEAVQMWKAGEVIDNKGVNKDAIPTNGLCQQDVLNEGERLVGEIGFYRAWNTTQTMPSTSVLSESDTFNSAFSSEMVFYPAGVQDLYYLNNESLELAQNKTYLIDVANGMIYSTTGISIKGVRVHSLAMAKGIMSGNMEMPLFASAEVSGGGASGGQVLAGNNEPEFLLNPDGSYQLDADGNKIKNPNYNPNGFQIYSDHRSNNLYKLYNNGDLYGKGVKGTQLNTSIEEMNKINAAKFTQLTLPSEVGAYKKIISGSETLYYIDNYDYLWAIGNNNSNKLGLTQEQQIEFTGREVIKLDVAGKKVDMCWDLGNILYVRTTDNCLYAMGGTLNDLNSYILGTGNTNAVETFTQVDFDNPNRIDYFTFCITGSMERRLIVACSDKTYYALGYRVSELSGVNSAIETYKKFAPIFNGYNYKYDETQNKYVEKDYDANADIDQDIKKIVQDRWYINILKNDNTLWHAQGNTINQFDVVTIGQNVKDVFSGNGKVLCIKNDDTVWGETDGEDAVGMGSINVDSPTQITLPRELVDSGIKEVYSRGNTIYYLSNSGKVYGSSTSTDYLSTEINEHKVIEIPNAPLISSFYNSVQNNRNYMGNVVIAEGTDGKLYSIGNKNIIFGKLILQSEWNKITDLKVKKVVVGENNSLAIIDFNNDLYVCGEDARILGLDISTKIKVSNLTKVEDVLINGKVSNVNFTEGTMNVLTNDGDLYVSGIFSTNDLSQEWPYGTHPGWSEAVDHYELVKIDIPKVTMLDSRSKEQIAIADNQIYTWGHNYYNAYYQSSFTPVVSKFNDIVDATKVKKMFIAQQATMILMNDGSIYIDGGKFGVEKSYSGIGLGNAVLENKSASFNNNKVTSLSASPSVAMFLTENGQVYGYGQKNILGINDTTSKITDQIQKLPIGNDEDTISQVIVGSGYAVAITDKGKVYGTGSNTYGILGRWIGVDRNSPNSRYKTAFEWVECPELEI